MGVLRNIDDERFCQLVVAGRDPGDAYKDIGGVAKHPALAAQRKMRNKTIRNRVEELMDAGARRAMLSRNKILERVYEDWELARKLGQMPAALTAAKLMGSELHRMFIDRKEIGAAGDFDKQTPEELLAYIKGSLGELGLNAKEVKELGINLDGLDDNQALQILPPVKNVKS